MGIPPPSQVTGVSPKYPQQLPIRNTELQLVELHTPRHLTKSVVSAKKCIFAQAGWVTLKSQVSDFV